MTIFATAHCREPALKAAAFHMPVQRCQKGTARRIRGISGATRAGLPTRPFTHARTHALSADPAETPQLSGTAGIRWTVGRVDWGWGGTAAGPDNGAARAGAGSCV